MIDDTRIGVALWVISTIIITLNTLSLPRNMSISAIRSLWNVQIVVARSLLKRRYSVWQCGGLTPVFVRGNISIVSLLTFFSGRRSAEMAVERMTKKKKKDWVGGGGGANIHASGWLFWRRLSPFDTAALFILPPPCYDPRYFGPKHKNILSFCFRYKHGGSGAERLER